MNIKISKNIVHFSTIIILAMIYSASSLFLFSAVEAPAPMRAGALMTGFIVAVTFSLALLARYMHKGTLLVSLMIAGGCAMVLVLPMVTHAMPMGCSGEISADCIRDTGDFVLAMFGFNFVGFVALAISVRKRARLLRVRD